VADKPTAQFSLAKWPSDQFNQLVPTQTVMTTDLLRPMVQVVQLEPAGKDDKSPDHYSSKDVPAGHRAPTARGLRKLASTAGVSFYDERRLDDGSDPNICGVSVMASMLQPTGQRITAPGSQMIDIRTWFGPDTTAAELAKFRKQFYAHVATRAYSRAIRGLLSLRASYPIADINKPFAVVSYVPNTAHPDVRAAMLAGMAGSVPALYGPEPAKAIGPGQETRLPEIADDDVIEGQVSEQPAADEPAWFSAAAPAAAVEAGHPLERALKAACAQMEASDPASGGPRSEEQATNLKALLMALGVDAVLRVLRRVFGLKQLSDITRAQAAAIFMVHDSEDNFAALWAELAAIEAAKDGMA
jgi:hypothetical protein